MKPIYFDNQATTRIDPKVFEVMKRYYMEEFGNPHSTENEYGRRAAGAIDTAKSQVAISINASPEEIFFTSGATESNNWLVHNIQDWSSQKAIHIIISQIEHKSLIEPLQKLSKERVEITWLPLDDNGIVNLDELENAIKDNTVLVSIIAANNEIGVVQPLIRIGELCFANGIFFHTDAAQALGKIELDVKMMNIDFMSISAHKCYGPMGIGALYISSDNIRKFLPLLTGGGQQQGLRAGTLPLPLCAGFGAACSLASKERKSESIFLKEMSTLIWKRLSEEFPDMRLNGHQESRLSGNLNFQLPGINTDQLLANCPQLALSSTSACSIASESHVLNAIGLKTEDIQQSLRVSLGRYTTLKDIEYLIQNLSESIKKLGRF